MALPALSQTTARRVFVAGVVVQVGIVVTGGLVRLTGSGLGCPTWPDCVGGSLTPVVNQPQGFNKYIEFGNRTLIVVLVAVGIACIVAARGWLPRRKPLVVLASVVLLGVLAQALLGGLTTLSKLNPYVVSSHFLLSMALIAAAVATYERSFDSGDGPPAPVVRTELVWLVRGIVVLAAGVLAVGTLVTGAGPHSGDATHPTRNGLDVRQITWLHADMVTLFVGLLIALLLAIRLSDAPAALGRRARFVLYVTLGQGALGYLQYFTGVPWVLVAFHMLGSALLWVSVLRLAYGARTRSALVPAAPPSAQASAASTAAANLSGAPGA